MVLPTFITDSKDLSLLQTAWAQRLNPIITSPPNNSVILKNVALINGTTVIDHKLGRTLQGWKIVRQRASASIYDAQDANQRPNLTLVLVSNAAVVCDIEVF
jgi:hypothetical protein